MKRSSLLVVLACCCSPATRTTAPPPPPSPPAQRPPEPEVEPIHEEPDPASAVDEVRVRAALDAENEALVLAEMVAGKRRAWLLFFPSGDDLYAKYVEFGDNVPEALCRANADFLTFDLYEPFTRMVPKVTLDKSACGSPERHVLAIADGSPPKITWLSIEHDPNEAPPGWYASWDEYGLGTELWVWQLVTAKPETPTDERFGGVYEMGALTGGAPPSLTLSD